MNQKITSFGKHHMRDPRVLENSMKQSASISLMIFSFTSCFANGKLGIWQMSLATSVSIQCLTMFIHASFKYEVLVTCD